MTQGGLVSSGERYGWNSATLADERASNGESKAQPEAIRR